MDFLKQTGHKKTVQAKPERLIINSKVRLVMSSS